MAKPVKLNIVRVPFDRAVEYLREKVDIGTEAYTDLLHEAHDRAFVVAGLAKGALLADVHALINDAVQNGRGRDHFQREFRKVIDGRWLPTDKTGQPNTGWRARVIYETNIRTAYAAGEHQQMQRLKKTHPFWRYRHGDSRVARPDHLSWDGLTLRADDPWWQTHYPPNGFGCRCYVEPVSGAEMEDLGKVGRDGKPTPDIPPPAPMRQVKYGDRIIEVPQGIDPGWAYTPGASLEDAARAQTTAKQLDRMPPEIAERVRAEIELGPAPPGKTIDELLDEQELAAKAKKAAEIKASVDIEAKVAEWSKQKMEAMEAYSEPVMKELLKETGVKFTNPIEFRDLGDDEAEYDPETKTITVSTRLMDKLRKAEKKGTLMETWDGGGFFVDRETLERVKIPPREYLKNTLAHELAHKKYLDHVPEFHELMYNHIVAGGSTYTDQLYVWSGTEGYARPMNRPDMVDEATWENMKKEKRMQERAAKRRVRQ